MREKKNKQYWTVTISWLQHAYLLTPTFFRGRLWPVK